VRTQLPATIVFGLVLALPSPAASAPLWGYVFQANAGAHESKSNTHESEAKSGSFDEREPDELSAAADAPGQFGRSFVSGEGGVLHVFAAGGVSDLTVFEPFAGASGSGSVFARYFDTLTITSGTLPFGTAVTFDGVFTIDGATTFTGADSPADDCGRASIDNNSGFVFSDGSANVAIDGGAIAVGECESAGAFAVPFSIQTFVGDVFTLSYTVSVSAGGNLTYNDASGGGSATYDALHTAALVLTSQTAGGNYHTASGFRFDAPTVVPEPGSLLLALTALAAAGLKTRGHWKKPSQRRV
jgi:hypothetical protein